MNVDSIGAAVRLYTTELDDIGVMHAPAPVEPDDLVAREHGPPLRVGCVAELVPDGHIRYVVEVEEARLGLDG
jgi:hypothetical protein